MTENTIKTLIIDDEILFSDVLVKRLRKRGIDADTADSGEAGLVLLNKCPVDVVVLDVCMPGMDGFLTLETIKKNWPLIEIIMLSGHACTDAACQGIETGAFDYLMKPIDIEQLIFKIEDAYENARLLKNKLKIIKGGDPIKNYRSTNGE